MVLAPTYLAQYAMYITNIKVNNYHKSAIWN